jgi:predicted phage gp36 major capsid-like protein
VENDTKDIVMMTKFEAKTFYAHPAAKRNMIDQQIMQQ